MGICDCSSLKSCEVCYAQFLQRNNDIESGKIKFNWNAGVVFSKKELGIQSCGCGKYQTCHKHLAPLREKVLVLSENWKKGMEKIFNSAFCELEKDCGGDRMITIVLSGQMPSGKNSVNVTRSGHRYPNQRFVDWREKAMLEVKMQLKSQTPLNPESHFYMEMWYWKGDLRRRDVPGIEDALCHLFEKMGIVKDDALICDQNFHAMELDRKNPRIKIQLSEIDRV